MTASLQNASRNIAPLLLDWYDQNARSLPWRAKPGEAAPDPYRVWLSEVMLQQTTVAVVKPYFDKFTARWPDIDALAAADEAEVMSAWAGLGYYSRARNLVKCAAQVAEMGAFPSTEAELRRLPGVGDYTAAAIAAIAFGERAVVVDANVERVVSRLFAIAEPLPASRKQVRQRMDAITPDARSGDFAQAMMDLSAGTCIPREPKCELCPLSAGCDAKKAGDPAHYPVRAAKKPKPMRRGTAFWIERDKAVWLVTRPAKGMLGGMRALPDDGWSAQKDGTGEAPMEGIWRSAGVVRHTFSHAHLELTVRVISALEWTGKQSGEWWPIETLDQAGLPTLFVKAARLAAARD